MADIEKVIKGLQAHESGCGYRSHHCDDMDCPYRYGDESCDIEEMCHDALELLKKQENEISRISNEYLDLVKVASKQPQIVRCKDCKNGRVYDGDHGDLVACEFMELSRELNWFYADGEKKR